MPKISQIHHFPELLIAQEKGFSNDATIHTDGTIQVHCRPERHCKKEEVDIEPLYSSSANATVYLMKAKDGTWKANSVEYHEHR